MTPWANHPNIDANNHITVTTSKELKIPSNKIVDIKLGLILITLPKNHIIKIHNPLKSFKLISDFWLPSCNELTLSIITKTPLHIHIGETLCYLQLLPIHIFLPGTSFTLPRTKFLWL